MSVKTINELMWTNRQLSHINRTTTNVRGTIALLMMMQHPENSTSHAQNERETKGKEKKERIEVNTFFSLLIQIPM
jgi:hypothetical protein